MLETFTYQKGKFFGSSRFPKQGCDIDEKGILNAGEPFAVFFNACEYQCIC